MSNHFCEQCGIACDCGADTDIEPCLLCERCDRENDEDDWLMDMRNHYGPDFEV